MSFENLTPEEETGKKELIGTAKKAISSVTGLDIPAMKDALVKVGIHAVQIDAVSHVQGAAEDTSIDGRQVFKTSDGLEVYIQQGGEYL